MKKRWILLIVVVVLIGFFIYGNSKADILDYRLGSHTNIASHIHPALEIDFLGDKVTIPGQTGIDSRGMRVIHTHDSTGKLHVEAPRPHQFYLKDFFTIWGRNFNSTCLLGECIDSEYAIEVTVNGFPSELYEDTPLRDADKIKISYKLV